MEIMIKNMLKFGTIFPVMMICVMTYYAFASSETACNPSEKANYKKTDMDINAVLTAPNFIPKLDIDAKFLSKDDWEPLLKHVDRSIQFYCVLLTVIVAIVAAFLPLPACSISATSQAGSVLN